MENFVLSRVAEVLEDWIPEPACERVARQIVEVLQEILSSSKNEPLSLIDRFAPGGDLWNPK